MQTRDICKAIWWQPLSPIWVALEIFHIVLEELPSNIRENWRIIKMISSGPWWIWDIVLFAGLILITLKGVNRLIFQKEEEFKKQLGNYQNEIEQLKIQLDKNETYMQLSEAVKKLRQEGLKRIKYGYSLDSNYKMQNPDNEYERLARLLAEHMDIYGKQPASSIGDWVKINEHTNNGFFKKLASEFYIKRYVMLGPDFIDLAIKKNDLDKAIEEILSSNTIYQG